VAVQLAACCICDKQKKKKLQEGIQPRGCEIRNRRGCAYIWHRHKGILIWRRLCAYIYGNQRTKHAFNVTGDTDTEITFRFCDIPKNFELHEIVSKWQFLGGQYSNHSVGPTDESTIKNYIRRQDVSNVDNQAVYSIKTFGDTADLVGGEDPNEKVYKGEALMSLCSKAI
jgi:hypothetical protein